MESTLPTEDPEKKIKDAKTNKNIAFLIMLVLGIFLIFGLYKFLNAALGAVIMYIISLPLYHFFNQKVKLSKTLAAFVAMIITFLSVMLPLIGIIYSLTNKLSGMLSDTTKITTQAKQLISYIQSNLNIELITDDNIAKLKDFATSFVSQMLAGTFTSIADVVIMYFLLFYMLRSNKQMEETLFKYLPYSRENAKKFKKELKAQVYSNVIGAPLLATIQGCSAVLGFWIFGVDEPIFWGLMCGVFSFIPFVGSALIWLPTGLFQLTLGHNWQGIAILLYGALVITNIDNVLRFVLQKKFADVHPIITVLGVIIGIDYFGIAGVVFGPLLISFFLLTLKIFFNEFVDQEVKIESEE